MHIMTVCGRISPKDLGLTLIHEHMFIDLYRLRHDANEILDDRELTIQELECFRQAGGCSIVEVTPIDTGRNPMGLKAVAERTGLHVIMGTGYYHNATSEPIVSAMSTNQIADLLIREITVGVGATGVRAGIIGEIGSRSAGVLPTDERVLRAAARAHLQTGLSITTHAPVGYQGLTQIAILREEGVPPDRTIIGHVDTVPDIGYHRAVAETGAYLGYDCIGKQDFCLDSKRVQIISQMIAAGYASQILLSQDVCKKGHLKAYGGWGYDHLLTNFVPLLKVSGMSADVVEMMLVTNPMQALCGA